MRNLEDKRAAWRKWYHLHKKDQDKKIYFNRSKRKAVAKVWLEEYKKTIFCESCGESDPCCLDFHHKDPKEKDFALGDAIKTTQSIDRLKKEIAKCNILCANCHRKEHNKLKRDVA
jgi:hypothetical protein